MRIIVDEAGLTPALLRTVQALAKTYPVTTGHALSKRAGELL